MRWKFALAGLILLLGAIGAGWITVSYWGYLFSKTVVGEVVGIDRVTRGDNRDWRRSRIYSCGPTFLVCRRYS